MNAIDLGLSIKRLRENADLTQAQLADMISVTDKAVSKWETGRGYPDITLIEPLALALSVSVAELLSGIEVSNTNRSFNMQKIKFYVCPVCGNIITASGEAAISCCGLVLPPLEAENGEAILETVEDEYLISPCHEMSKEHHISFIACVYPDSVALTKLYPEGDCSARFKMRAARKLYWYCNRHGLFTMPVNKRKQQGI